MLQKYDFLLFNGKLYEKNTEKLRDTHRMTHRSAIFVIYAFITTSPSTIY